MHPTWAAGGRTPATGLIVPIRDMVYHTVGIGSAAPASFQILDCLPNRPEIVCPRHQSRLSDDRTQPSA